VVYIEIMDSKNVSFIINSETLNNMSVRIAKLVERAEAIITDDTQNLDQFWRRVMDYKKKRLVTFARLSSKTFVIVSQSIFQELEDYINKPVLGEDSQE